MKLSTKFNTYYVGFIFVATALVFVPTIIFFGLKLSWHNIGLKLHNTWSKVFVFLTMLDVQIIWKHRPSSDERFIICSNHFSYFDIPLMTYLPFPFKFIGKSSIARVPIFGYMYRKLHVTVNRASFKSRAESMAKVREMVDHGFNIAFFPEGGIRTNNPPQMVPFKDGAFRVAIEKQLPILPVTIADNFKFLPDEPGFRVNRQKLRLIVHQPIIPPADIKEINEFRTQTFEVIQQELNRLHGNH